ncbi:MAG: protein kinase [Phormidesmis sp. RL_2_1]|nr:protein kinase [Phormidesmis sp. RL_2_1]
MQAAISIGTILQNHYRIIQLLGQGGFGRTYLAEDQGRFNERCAIKEFVPVQGADKFSDKATQLFQREASVLYQINHPQIPKFRATFEEEERLFLVQDYVEGPTYHEVLRDRRAQGGAFSETEVRLFLQQLLPVLAHIHAKGIIHRDVSPDNIILRQQDGLPVLIDFGVVKEVVTRMQMDGVISHATTVGKAGYAPSEQMQTGRAYPSSDLYALAVTAIVLLTGQEPQALFDDVNATWRWQDEVTVSPGLATVLNKSLSYKPGDRFQSVSQMAQALKADQAESGLPLASFPQPPSQQPSSQQPPSKQPSSQPSYNQQSYPPTPPMSQMKTVAVGRPLSSQNEPNQGTPTVNRPTTVRQPIANAHLTMPSERERSPSILDNPLAVGGLAVGLAAVAGFGGWAVVRSLDTAVTPSPSITSLPPLGSGEPTPTPTPTQSTPTPVEYDQQPLNLEPGVTKSVRGNMRRGDKVNYPLTAKAGQILNVEQFEKDARFSVLGPDGEPISFQAADVQRWQGELEEDGEYVIQLTPATGVNSSNYRLEATLSAAPEPTLEPTPEIPDTEVPPPDTAPGQPTNPPLQPDIQSQRVSFPAGSDGILVANSVAPGQIRRYVVNAQEGQIMTVRVTEPSQGPVSFDLLLPGGEMLADASGIVYWEGFLPVGGDYSIDVQTDRAAEFTLEIRASSPLQGE